MRKAIGMIFAGGRVEDLSVLTGRRPKSAVVFGGIYRTIDFALTNMANAGIGQVGILTQYRPASLMDHVGTGQSWDLVGSTRGVRFLPPSMGHEGAEWYRGPADAMFQNLEFIERSKADDVLAVSGDHLYSMDYERLLNFHYEKDADLTMAFCPMEKDASRFGIGELNAAGQILGFTEKPQYPRANLASMSVYVFKREVLIDELKRAIQGVDGQQTFQIHEVLRRMMSHRRAYGYVHRGVWEYTRTLDEYYEAHKMMLGSAPRIALDDWEVRTNLMARRTSPPSPARLLPGSQVENSLVSGNCVIEGTVKGSVLSPGVRVGKGAVVVDCVLHHDVVVEEGARLTGVISDKKAVFGKGCEVGAGALVASQEMPGSLTCGATLVGYEARIPAGLRIGRNCIIHAEIIESDLTGEVPSGESRWPASARKAVAP
jgi:glucose-1-phosphate adenylyltransferase